MKTGSAYLNWVIKTARAMGAEKVEASVSRQSSILKRIWYGKIHQNPAGDSYGLNLGLIKDGRYVSGSLSTFDEARTTELIEKLLSEVPHMPETDLPELSTEFPEGFPGEQNMRTGYDTKTAALSSHDAILKLSQLQELLRGADVTHDIVWSGKMVMSEGEAWFGNSNDVRLRRAYTGSLLNCYAFPNPYDEPEMSTYSASGHFALAPILGWVAMFSFNGLNYLRGSSALAGQMGQIVTGANISIMDEPLRFSPSPFDGEGYPKKTVTLIDKGILKAIATDSILARMLKLPHTAHASSPTGKSGGAMPSQISLAVDGAPQTAMEMAGRCRRPTIWITKTHYIAMPHIQSAEVTGTTQHGVFLIDNGEVTPIYNLRFKQKIFEALKNVEAAGPQEIVYDAWDEGGTSPFFLPALKIKNFKFLGGTSLEN
ncbi:MAG: hypothetical protein HYW88_01115 [Candidatus Sungbacteria bacterium]|nr:hypothetical protein [Candidatus Sungbacteria bacterium]